MKFICISDTHLKHPDLSKYPADCIIHAGDATMNGTLKEIARFLEWFGSLNYEYKIMIPGNHDFLFEESFEICKILCEEKNITCLNDSVRFLPRTTLSKEELEKPFDPHSTVIDGGRIKVWGSPVTPRFYDWAFNRVRGDAIQRHWDMIPENVDILITHGPPANTGKLSVVLSGEDVGCENLKNTILAKKPKYHIFGHIHEGYGILKTENTTYINCSVLNRSYQLVNDPVVFEI